MTHAYIPHRPNEFYMNMLLCTSTILRSFLFFDFAKAYLQDDHQGGASKGKGYLIRVVKQFG